MISILNSLTPKPNDRAAVATFRLELYRDGDRLVLDTPSPVCHRDFHNLTGAEKDAYNYIVRLILEHGVEAMRRAEKEAAERAYGKRNCNGGNCERAKLGAEPCTDCRHCDKEGNL